MLSPALGSGSAGTSRPMARATSLKQMNPLRRHSRAATTGARFGDRERYSAAESRTESSPVTQEDIGFGDRHLTSGREGVGLSATCAGPRSHAAYRSGRVSIVDMPEPSA